MTTILILLVGGNPLPNYVTANYHFLSATGLERPDQIILIVSPEMQSVTETLAGLLQSKFKVSVEPIEFKPDTTYINLAYALEQYIKVPVLLHLNYTGGTKQMAVRAIQAVDYCCTQLKPGLVRDTISSYLDAGSYQLRFDKNNAGLENTGDLRLRVELSFEELLKLHEQPHSINAYNKEPHAEYTPVVNKLRHIASYERRDLADFRRWAIGQNGKSDELAGDGLSEELKQTLPNPHARWKNDAGLKELLVENGWMIEFMLAELPGCNSEPPLTDWAAHLRLQSGIKLDLALLQGYQLTVVSCVPLGISDYDQDLKNRLRGKAFETRFLAQQLGGEEARAIIVTLAEEDLIKQLNAELKTSFGTGEAPVTLWPYTAIQDDNLTRRLSRALKK